MGFDPRRWRPSSTARPITGALEALQAENDALRRELRALRLQLELLLAGRDRAAAPGAAAGRRQASNGRPASADPPPAGGSHGLSPALVEHWAAAMGRHPRWHSLRLGPPGGLRGLLEQLRSRSWPPDLSLEQQLDRRAAGLGTELAAALRGPHSRGRLAVRAAFAFYGPRAIEWLSEEPLRVVEELLRQIERLGPSQAGPRQPGPSQPGPSQPGPRRGTRTQNHSQAATDPGGRSRTRPEAAAEPDGSRGAGPGASGGGSAAAGGSRQGRAGSHQAGRSGAEAGGSRQQDRGGGAAGGSRQGRAGSHQAGRSGAQAGGSRQQDPGGGGGGGGGAGPSRQAENVGGDPRQQALALLGLTSDASPEAIKRAYRRLAKAHHPDLGGDVEAFHRLDAAYRLLL